MSANEWAQRNWSSKAASRSHESAQARNNEPQLPGGERAGGSQQTQSTLPHSVQALGRPGINHSQSSPRLSDWSLPQPPSTFWVVSLILSTYWRTMRKLLTLNRCESKIVLYFFSLSLLICFFKILFWGALGLRYYKQAFSSWSKWAAGVGGWEDGASYSLVVVWRLFIRVASLGEHEL